MLKNIAHPANIDLIINLLLILLFISSAVTDFLRNKIYNFQTYSAMASGLILWSLIGGWHGTLFSFLGLLVGFTLLFVFYLLGGMGAGDVKLLGAIGALKGAKFVLWTMFYTGLVGGVMGLSLIIWHGKFLKTMKNVFSLIRHPSRPLPEDEAGKYVPYGVAISVGCLWALLTVA